MKAWQIVIGALWFLAGAAALLIVALAVTSQSLLNVVDAGDLVVLLLGALVVGLGALVTQHFEYSRSTPATRAEGARPATETLQLSGVSLTWGSLAFICGVAVACGVTPPVSAAADAVSPARGTFENLVIDGDRDKTSVQFRHEHAHEHIAKSVKGRPCGRCHHLNLPGDEATSCSECHRSMSKVSDIFDHDFHADLESVGGCEGCHPAETNDRPRTRKSGRFCVDCHGLEGTRPMDVMVSAATKIELNVGLAPSYEKAMHGLCVECHREAGLPEKAKCYNCHPIGGVRESD